MCFVVMAPHVDKAGKARILALLEAGMSVRDVCAKVGRDRRTVQRLRANFRKQSQQDQDLKKEIVKFWCQVINDTDYCQKVVASMPRRLQRVIEMEGGHTKY